MKSESMFYNTNSNLLVNLITSKKLYVGLKVHVYGLKKAAVGFKNPDNFNFMPPTFYKQVEIDYNSIARAPWTAKLG